MGKYACGSCGATYPCRAALRRHRKRVHHAGLGKTDENRAAFRGESGDRKSEREDVYEWEVLLDELNRGPWVVQSEESEMEGEEDRVLGESVMQGLGADETSSEVVKVNACEESESVEVNEESAGEISIERVSAEKAVQTNTRPVLVIPKKRPDGWLEVNEWRKRLDALDVWLQEEKAKVKGDMDLMERMSVRSVRMAREMLEAEP